jgi:hypothetical protein
MPHNLLRQVRLLKILHLLLTQRLPPDAHRLIQPIQIAKPADRNRPLLHNPRQRHLAHLPALLLRQLVRPADDLLHVGILGLLEHRVPLHALLTLGDGGFGRAGEQTAVEGRPGDEPDARFGAVGVHFAFFFAVAEGVVVLGLVSRGVRLVLADVETWTHLHAHELRPAILLSRVLHFRELIRPHAARADVADLPLLDEIVQRFHRLLHRNRRVESVDLQQIDIRGLQSLQTGVHRTKNGLSAQPTLIYVVLGVFHLWVLDVEDGGFLADGAEAFREDDELLAGEVKFLDGFPDHDLGDAVRVHVGGVPGVEAAVVGAF